MGLSLAVGLLVDLREADEEGFDHFRQQFEAVNQALKAVNLGPHHEPIEPKDTLPWSGDMWGYSGLHHLRRIAAHQWAGNGLPPPGTVDAAKDAVAEKYYQRNGEPPASIFKRVFGRASGQRPRFEHLMFHSDAEGFYLPMDFEMVIFPADELKVAGAMIGSAPRLLQECQHLAEVLGIPSTAAAESNEVVEAAESQGEGEGWRKYGIEAFSCLQLIEACRRSISTGAAVAFV